jgi:hypothetical protein
MRMGKATHILNPVCLGTGTRPWTILFEDTELGVRERRTNGPRDIPQ